MFLMHFSQILYADLGLTLSIPFLNSGLAYLRITPQVNNGFSRTVDH